MKAAMLAEFSDLFSREALKKDERGDPDEAERLWDIAHELHEHFKRAEHVEARETIR